MNILINHCWCSDSIWGGNYSCRVIVGLDRVPEGKTYYDPPCPDWSLLQEHKFDSGDKDKLSFRNTTLRVRPDVINWLNANVKDIKLHKWEKDNGQSSKGWAVGTDKYNSQNTISFAFFFQRRRDGMAFIKHWSVHKKPVSYLQYFTDVRKELNFKTGKLVTIKH
jgi:hypothetical protein